VSATWRRLVEQGAASCLVCGGETRAGRPCPCCGSELS
jgi:ribosomal protein L32